MMEEIFVFCGWWFSNQLDIVLETHFSCGTVDRGLWLAILSSLLCPETDMNICIGKQGYVFYFTDFKKWCFHGHVVLPGTPEHRNITEHSETPEKPGTPPKNPEHSQENQEHPQENPEHPEKKPRNLKKQMYRQYVTARVSFSKLPPLIAHKIIWFDLHNLENSYKRHTGTIFLPASRFVMCPQVIMNKCLPTILISFIWNAD